MKKPSKTPGSPNLTKINDLLSPATDLQSDGFPIILTTTEEDSLDDAAIEDALDAASQSADLEMPQKTPDSKEVKAIQEAIKALSTKQ